MNFRQDMLSRRSEMMKLLLLTSALYFPKIVLTFLKKSIKNFKNCSAIDIVFLSVLFSF